MLDKRTAVAENDDLMRAAAAMVIRFAHLAEVSLAGDNSVTLDDVWIEVCDLSTALRSIDPNWEAHYGK
jgi:hypothetical protein